MGFIENRLREQNEKLRAENKSLREAVQDYKRLEAANKAKQESLEKQLDGLRRLESQWKDAIAAHQKCRDEYNALIGEAREFVLEITKARQERRKRMEAEEVDDTETHDDAQEQE